MQLKELLKENKCILLILLLVFPLLLLLLVLLPLQLLLLHKPFLFVKIDS
jgi:hypothetical protein